MILLQQMMILFTYMMLGFLSGKKGGLNKENTKAFSWFILNIANNAMLLSASLEAERGIGTDKLLEAAGLSIAIFGVLLVLAEIVPKIFKVPEQEAGLYKVMTVFNNIGFMGFPIVAAVYGQEALLYAAIFTMPFNILFYTYGMRAASGRKNEGKGLIETVKSIVNVGVIASVLAIVLYLWNPYVPEWIRKALNGMGNVTPPLSMFIAGVSLAAIPLRSLFTDKRFLLFTATKLFVFPIVGVSIIKQVLDNPMLVNVCMVMLATPVASMTVVLAQKYDRNVELATKAVALTTLLSVMTIPLISSIVL